MHLLEVSVLKSQIDSNCCTSRGADLLDFGETEEPGVLHAMPYMQNM